MRDAFRDLLEQSSYFMPHGHCYLWIPSLLWLHVVADLLIGAAYLGISLVLWMLVRRLRLPFSPVFIAFGLFIALCGLTHFMGVWTTWHPDYLASGMLKAATAAASVATAIGLLFVKPQVEAVVHAARLSEERRTQLESAHAELEALYKKVKDLDELKSQFFANVSHELRTPLALILGPAEQLLGDESLSPRQHEQLTRLRSNAQTLLKQVNDLLDLSKLEAGGMTVQHARVDLGPWTRRVTSVFDDLAAQRGLRLSVQAPSSLTAEVDAAKLERVLVNLLANALKFTPAGGTVRVELRGSADRVALQVSDTGPGIPPHHRDAVFERFRQLDGGATRDQGGTGLGLAIVRDFVGLHGGEVGVDEAPGGGARFVVELPRFAPPGSRVTDEAAGPDAVMAAALQGALNPLRAVVDAPTSEAPRPDALRPHVLLVEDNPEMRDFVRSVLSERHAVSVAADGEEGLAQAEALRPDLIVSDVMMPRMSGYQFLAALRRRPHFDTTPVLLLTARADDALRVQLLEQGAQDYLTKPFAPAELQARVRNLVAMKRAGDLLRGELHSLETDLESLGHQMQVKHRALQTALDATAVAREQAERASQVKTTFLGLISHEMRTPLSTIHMNLQLLLRDKSAPLPDGLQVKLDRLISASRQLSTLIEGILEYTRLESGRLDARHEALDLHRLAAEVVEEFHQQATPQRRVELRLQDDGPVPLHSDPRLLRVVLSNLLANALKFTSQGSVDVHVSRDEGRGCMIEVRDTGVGIEPEDLDRIFLPFEQLEPLQRKSIPGVGLGLTLVRQIVLALEGRIEVESQPGQGTSFRVRLPEKVAGTSHAG